MSLLVVGLSHRSAPVSVLERASLAVEARTKLLQDTLAAEPATEAAVLATCNRIELYADVDKFHAGVAELSTLLAQHSGVGLDELTPYLYVHYEDRAVHHLFSVACGLDSMVVGEGQILGQIKDALALGQELHTAGRLLNDLFQQALRVGKRAHSETGIDRAGQSLVTFGLQQLADGDEVTAWAAGKRALVIGAGSMSSLAAATLARAGVDEIVVANRTRARADRLVEILGQAGVPTARAVAMAGVADELTRADVVVSCTGATGLVLTAEAVAGALGVDFETATQAPEAPAAAPGELDQHAAWVENGSATAAAQDRAVRRVPVRPAATGPARLHLLDLAMPRDIDGAAHRVDGVRLVDIESLAEASADAPMAADVDQVRTIVADEVAAFGAAQRAAHITPTVVALRTMAADVVAGEIARLDGRLPDLDEKQRAEITQTVRRVVDKLLHAPTVRVKQLASEPGGAGYADALRELFDLDPQTVAAVSRADLNDPNRGRS
ncbi:glutamyl-tRNA reductase [Streptomyces sp. NBC_01693]|uniref:Glutamyl-tRNA reductase n=1 Tax=Streptomyces sp. gb1(2016) TaxID=1828321 RepID=A0A652KSW2_9ACTN|nr:MULTISPECIES: glutamyl-tRNA reductase [unclassified Streptomyces]WSS62620.1 glutamyl-tRNA reductase [Streptomyces sp. NBC_01177]WSS69617.1 glutamyl-tRNA reductase [Streptomyces sp. NBC_01175]WSS76633.1 glutamyl-tRNA reductase [Streptomyces sp. NBC_01174]MDX3432944.1 glutamyl-tRNA reductase [Streptomyces sp. ME01-18a]MDX3688325.1 glutamyl-tRNA reductase [Streptomyces sp. AK04-4c]